MALTLNVTDETGGVGVAYTEYRLDGGPGQGVAPSPSAAKAPTSSSTARPTRPPTWRTPHAEVRHRHGEAETKAPNAASVAYGTDGAPVYQVVDPLPNGGTATVTIKIKNGAGTVVRRLGFKGRP